MLRIAFLGGVATIAMAMAVPASAGEAGVQIEFADNFFAPKVAGPVTVDASIPEAAWARDLGATEAHNISSNNKLFRSGDPSDSLPGYTLQASAGTFKYICDEHSAEGMRGTLKVVPAINGMPPDKAKVTWANAQSKTGDRYDVQFRQKGKPKWEDWFEGTKRKSAVFGRNNKPVNVKPNKTYQVRARSRKGTNKNRQSNWSPPREFKTNEP
jgi:plastocyanin